jgi:glycosyltransferase involved in cell wall biosynthesis
VRVSYIHGICVNHDAISSAIKDEITWLLSVPGNEIRLFTYACDFQELPFKVISNLKDVVFDTFFQQSDIVIFHFGVFYPLFNILPVVPKTAKRIVVFHNITPREYLPVSAHEIIDKSFQQMSNIAFANHVVCVSQINQQVLSSHGINVPSTILPLALHGGRELPKRKPSFDDGVARILFVGRFVKSKGPCDLLTAISMILAEREDIFLEIDFVGNLKFSDPDVLGIVRSTSEDLLARFGCRLVINLHGDASESVKNNLLARADIFVLPSRHEGFCVPILEAFKNGCCVVSYNNSNILYISGGFAKLAPTGDVVLLAREVLATLALIRSEDWIAHGGYEDYWSDLSDYCKQFESDRVRRRFLNLVSDVFQQKGVVNA